MTMKTPLAAAMLSLALAATAPAQADQSIIVQSTTSTANAGLYAHLLPSFEAISGVAVHVVAVGTGRPCAMPGIAMATCCWSTPGRRRRRSSPMASASNVSI